MENELMKVTHLYIYIYIYIKFKYLYKYTIIAIGRYICTYKAIQINLLNESIRNTYAVYIYLYGCVGICIVNTHTMSYEYESHA